MAENPAHYAGYQQLIESYRQTQDESHLKAVFTLLDLDGDKVISKDELAAFFRVAKPSANVEEEVIINMRLADTNRDGFLEESEFVRFLKEKVEMLQPGELQEKGQCFALVDQWRESHDPALLEAAFKLIDANGDGVISKAELLESDLVRQTRNREAWANFYMATADLNDDGVLTLEEFQKLASVLH